MGVWIETGAKIVRDAGKVVTPYVGVWIETGMAAVSLRICLVTPYVGVWIETNRPERIDFFAGSLLMWECGLKPNWSHRVGSIGNVTPYVGVWIETQMMNA